MKFKVDPKIFKEFPGVRIGVLAILFSIFAVFWLRSTGVPFLSPREISVEKGFLTKSRSSIQASFPQIGEVTIYLYSSDEKHGTVEFPYCGGGLGAKTYDGAYELVLVRNGEAIDRLPVGNLSFVENYPFDGQLRMEAARVGKEQKIFITLFQYRSCNMNEVLVFGCNEMEGKLFQSLFVRKEGHEAAAYVNPNQTRLLVESEDRFISRFYDNSVGKFRATEWEFDPAEQRFEEVNYWEE